MFTASNSTLKSRLALGTVQFGLPYGVSNSTGQVPPQTAAEILRRAETLGIDLIDTAIAYGSSEQVMGELGVNNFRIVSKLPSVPEGETNVYEWILSAVDQSLARLKRNSLYGLLLHRSDILTGKHAASTRLALRHLKASGKVAKSGVSIYGPDELDALDGTDDIELVQSPLNILDTRLVDSGWLTRLNRDGVEVHIRSVFLQGLLLMPDGQRPPYFHKWSDVWSCWQNWLAETGQTPLEAALRYVLSVENIERIVIGVETSNQLDQIAAAEARGAQVGRPTWPHSPDTTLINPSLWNSQ